ncbi:hypothetical protein FDP41_011556 [Naegleria fowleri]|uniref:Spindle pole body component n=2 Tax=Naegleria fowleri TaxID=5763 RepID=A0A6A5C4F6_NAEFO|nr:uncharacterized protein FDP41_011556 [Naegleria fowleri]KAF0982626.1 hypothetical protein FDP41_011556 [Naegleria fowleri]
MVPVWDDDDLLEEYKKSFADSKSDDELSDWSEGDEEENQFMEMKNQNEKQPFPIIEDSFIPKNGLSNNISGLFGTLEENDGEKLQDNDDTKFNDEWLFGSGNDHPPTECINNFHQSVPIAAEELYYSLHFDPNKLITVHVPFTHFPHQQLFEHYTIYKISQTPPLGNYRVLTPCNHMVKQHDLIREIFSMLRGHEGSIFNINYQGFFELSHPNISVSFISRTLLHTVLKFFIQISNDLESIHVKCIRNIHSVKSTILQSYYSTLLDIILEIRSDLSEMERQNQLGNMKDKVQTLSLLSLRTLMFRTEQKVNILKKLDSQIDSIIDNVMSQRDAISDIVSCFYEKITHLQYLNIENTDEYDFVYRLLMSMLKSYLSIMDSWIYEGVIQDKFQEFMISKNDNLNIETPLFWTEGFTQFKIPNIFSNIKDKIISIGKSIILMKDIEIKHEITLDTSSLGDYMLDKEKPSLYRFLETALERDSRNSIKGVENQLDVQTCEVSKIGASPKALTLLRSSSNLLKNSNIIEDSKTEELLSPISEAIPIGSIHFMRSPPKKKRMLSILETEDLYSNTISDPTEKADSKDNSFFQLTLGLQKSDTQTSNIFNLLKKKSLSEVIEFQHFSAHQPSTSKILETPIEINFEIGLFRNIKDQYSRIAPYLCNLIVYRSKLIDHLTAIRAIFLMEAGDIMDYLSTQLFHLSDRFFAFDFRGITAFDIQMILRDTLRLGVEYPRRYSFATNNSTSCYTTDVFSSLNLEEKISVTFDDANVKIEDGNFFDGLVFHFDLEWPLNIIISSEHVQNYNEVLIFNLKLKQAKQVLETMSLKTDAFVHRSNAYLKYYSLLNQLKHFVSAVQYYMMNRILHTLWNELCDNVLSSQDLDDLRNYHQDYMNKIKDRFLLKKAQFVKNHIFKVVQICVKLRAKLNNFKETQREDIFLQELLEMEEEFKKSFKMLLTIINNILTRGVHEHCK